MRIVTILLTVLAAVANAEPKAATGIAALKDLGPVRPVRDWILLLYVVGDNDLEKGCHGLITRMEAVMKQRRLSGKVEVIALLDRAKGYTDIDGDWTSSRVYRIRPDSDYKKINSELLADCGELNMGDGSVLATFLSSAMKSFPARRTVLSIQDHGGGWASFAFDHDAPGHPKGKDNLTLTKLRGALKTALAAAGRKRIDILIFDMCLMGQLDVAVACKDLVDVVIFSEAISYGDNMPPALLHYGIPVHHLDTRAVARAAVDNWPGYWRRRKSVQRLLTLSAIDCRKVDQLVGALDALLAKLTPVAGKYWALFARSLFHASRYSDPKDLESKQNAVAAVDLIDAVKCMRANIRDFPAEAEYRAFLSAADQCILAKYRGTQRRRSHGLAIYAPPRPENVNPRYAHAPMLQFSQWPKFLGLLHAAQLRSLAPPRFHSIRILDPRGQVTDTIAPLQGHQCRFVLDGMNLLTVNFGIGTRYKDLGHLVQFKTTITVPLGESRIKGKTPRQIELLMPEYAQGRNIMGQELGGVLLQVASGDKAVYATVDTFHRPGTAVARGLYSDSAIGKDVKVDVIFDVNRWSVAHVIAHVKEPGADSVQIRDLVPRPEGVFRPHIDLITWLGATHTITHGEIKWGKGLRLIMNVVPPGEQALFLEARTVSGLPAVQRVPFKVRANGELDRYLKAPRKVTPAGLVGAWQLHTRVTDAKSGRQEFRATNTRVQFMPDPDDAPKLIYRMTLDGRTITGPAHLETLGLPLLSLCVVDTDGHLTRTALFVPFNDPAGGKGGIRLRDLASGAVHRLVKVGPAVTLVGRWTSKTGMVFQFDQRRYRMWVGGKQSDSGSYTAQGGTLTIKSDNGQTITPKFTLERDTLTIVDGESKTVLKRTPSR